jgi:hypothetical protein
MISVGKLTGKILLAPNDVFTARPKVNRQNIALRRELAVKMSAQGANMGNDAPSGPTDHYTYRYPTPN